MTRLRSFLLSAALLAAGGGGADAQIGGGVTYDPQQLPAIKGRVAQYSLTPRGDVDGLILDDGTQVRLPPHLGPQLVLLVKPGDAVTVRGLRVRAIPVVQALQAVNDASGQAVTNSGPPAGPRGPRGDDGQVLEAQGRIKASLYGPRGEINGALLEDGTQIHLPPPEAQRFAAQLAPGRTVFVRGFGLESPLGGVIGAQAIGPTREQATQMVAFPPPPGPGMQGPAAFGAPPPNALSGAVLPPPPPR